MKKVKITIQSENLTITDERIISKNKILSHLGNFKRIKYNLVPKETKPKLKIYMLSKIDFKVEIKEAEESK